MPKISAADAGGDHCASVARRRGDTSCPLPHRRPCASGRRARGVDVLASCRGRCGRDFRGRRGARCALSRGGAEGSLYPWGDAPPEFVPDYATRWKNGPEPVGLYPPNAYGLYNLGDNVHEWCADWYDDGYYAHSRERNPRGPASGSHSTASPSAAATEVNVPHSCTTRFSGPRGVTGTWAAPEAPRARTIASAARRCVICPPSDRQS